MPRATPRADIESAAEAAGGLRRSPTPTAAGSSSGSCLQRELLRSRVPLGCVAVLIVVGFTFSGGGEGAPTSPSAPPPSPPSPPAPPTVCPDGRTDDASWRSAKTSSNAYDIPYNCSSIGEVRPPCPASYASEAGVTPAAACPVACGTCSIEPPPPPPDPSQSKACRNQCKGNASWDLDDGPCIDARDSPTMQASYYAAVQFAKDFYAYSTWKRLDWESIEQAGAMEAMMADMLSDPSYLQLAVAKLVAAFPDGHVQREFITDDCGPAAERTAAQLRYDFIGGGFGLTVAQASTGAVIVTGVIPGSPAAAAGLKAGDLVEQIDGVPALQAVQDQKAEGWLWVAQCCSNPATDEHRLSEQFRSIARAKVGDRRLWTVQGRGSPVETTATADDFLTWNLTAPSSPYFDRWGPEAEDGSVHIQTKMVSETVGLIGVAEEDVDEMGLEMARAIATLQQQGATGIIVDLRGNDGGDDDQGPLMVDFFVPEGTPRRFYEQASWSNRMLSVVKKGEFRKYMNGTNLNDYAIVPSSATDDGGDDDALYIEPLDVEYYKERVPGFNGPFTGKVVCMINRYCDSTCEGIAQGFADLSPSRAAVTGFEGTLGSFGMSGGTMVMPSDFTFELPFGRSLDKEGVIQIDSDWTGKGGVQPTVPLPRTPANLQAFIQQRMGSVEHRYNSHGDVELDWALSVLSNLGTAPKTVLVFGDSWGDVGPTWRQIRDTFAAHGVPVTVRNAAIGGTTACQWDSGTAGKGGGKFAKGQALAAKALELFPETNGKVDFVWYTAGGNDLMADTEYHACENAIGDGAHYHEHPELYGEHLQCVQVLIFYIFCIGKFQDFVPKNVLSCTGCGDADERVHVVVAGRALCAVARHARGAVRLRSAVHERGVHQRLAPAGAILRLQR